MHEHDYINWATSFLSISVYENDIEAEANMEARTKLHELYQYKSDFFIKVTYKCFFNLISFKH